MRAADLVDIPNILDHLFDSDDSCLVPGTNRRCWLAVGLVMEEAVKATVCQQMI